MRKEVLMIATTLALLAACTPTCDQTLACEDGKTFPAEQLINGSCAPINYLKDPCSPAPNETVDEHDTPNALVNDPTEPPVAVSEPEEPAEEEPAEEEPAEEEPAEEEPAEEELANKPERTPSEEKTLSWQEARELVKDAFHNQWSELGAKCGKFVDGRQEPHIIKVIEQDDGYRVHIEYYCGTYAKLPAEPDHRKDVHVRWDGTVAGI